MFNHKLNDFSRQVIEIMPLIYKEFAKRENNDLTQGKISCPQMVTLDYVLRMPRVKMKDIAGHLGIQEGSATTLVARLIREKMLKRRHDEKDRRLVWVTITPRGKKVVKQILEQKRRSIGEIFSVLTDKERSQYLGTLKKVYMGDLNGKIFIKALLLPAIYCLLSAALISPGYCFFPFDTWGKDKSKSEEASSVQVKNESPLTLEEAYRLALKQSEDVAMKQGELDKAQGHMYQALNEIMPDVNFLMTESIQDAPRKDQGASSGSDGVSSNFTRRTNPQKKFTLHQPIFSGFKEIAGIQGSSAEKAQRIYEKRRTEEVLLTDVVSAFYAVIHAEKDVKTLDETKNTLQERMKELKERVDLGRSRENEIQTALSTLKQVESQLVSARSEAIVARQELEYCVGRPVNQTLDDTEVVMPEAEGIDHYLDRLDLRSDVEAANQAYILAEKDIVVAQSGLFPSAYLDGNYYTQRQGFQSGIDWDVLLSLNVPIFNGTETFGDIKVAHAEKEMAKYNFLKTKRLARLDIHRAYEAYRSARLEEAALKEAVDATKKDYDLQSEDYKLNLVNNLDVLASLRNYQDLSRLWNAVHYATKIKYWQLKVAIGETMDLGKEKQ